MQPILLVAIRYCNGAVHYSLRHKYHLIVHCNLKEELFHHSVMVAMKDDACDIACMGGGLAYGGLGCFWCKCLYFGVLVPVL